MRIKIEKMNHIWGKSAAKFWRIFLCTWHTHPNPMYLWPSISSVQFSCSVMSICNPMNCTTTGFSVHHQLTEFTQIHVHCVSDAIQPSHPLSSPSPPAFNLSQQEISGKENRKDQVFSNESVLRIRWPKFWSFSFGISPSNEYSGLISFRMDWLDLLAVQGTLKSLLQHTVRKHQFFGGQLSLESNSHIHTWLLEKL